MHDVGGCCGRKSNFGRPAPTGFGGGNKVNCSSSFGSNKISLGHLLSDSFDLNVSPDFSRSEFEAQKRQKSNFGGSKSWPKCVL